jgi:hypothetical protein
MKPYNFKNPPHYKAPSKVIMIQIKFVRVSIIFRRTKLYLSKCLRSRVSSGSIVSDYGLDNRATGVRSKAGEKDFSCILCVQTGSGTHTASCKMGTGGLFPRGKARPGRDVDHSPHLVLRSLMSRSCNSSPPRRSMACRGTSLLYLNAKIHEFSP